MDPNSDASPVAPETDGDGAYVPTGADYVSDRDFVDFPISPEVLKAIHELGYRTATPVQAASIEPALAGKDMLVRAKTGTGKTVAFCVPIIERIPDGERTPRAVILAPTRELAQQIAEEIDALVKYRDITHALLVGGVPMGPQERALEQGASIVVGTPGRVLDHMRRRHLDLSQAWVGTLDEADEMLSMGFYEDVTAILDVLPKETQILLFSATIGEQTERIIRRYLKDPEQLMLSTDADQVSAIEHIIYETPPGQHKVRSLLHLIDLEDPTSAIIFCNTREDAATVASFLDRQGLDVQLLSGELPQARRTKVMKKVKKGEVRFLVATDVAARGIDISDLSHVLNYSLPQDPSIYLHRTGRTGRIGKKGKALSLISGSDFTTRKVLESQHRIPFVDKKFPTPEAATQLRVERQAAQIRDAMGSMVFEAYVPTARAIMERDDAEGLIAAALRAFFQWDRTRRAAMSAAEDEDGEPVVEESFRPERKPKREERGRGEGRREDRKRDDRKREERPDRDRDRKRDKKKDGDRKKKDRVEAAPGMADDLDALLLEDDDAAAPTGAAAPTDLDDLLVEDEATASTVAAPSLDEDEDDEDKKKKKRRRRRKKKGEEDASAAETGGAAEGAAEAPSEGGDLDDLDALLSAD